MNLGYEIIKPHQLYPIFTGIYIISGTPFLLIKNQSTIIIGDLHFGHESSLFQAKDNANISQSTKLLIEQLKQIILKFNIEKVICNGDIKHYTKSIKIQELTELKSFMTTLIELDVKIEVIRGNHDEFLEFIFPHINMDNLKLVDYIQLDNIIIHHGHMDHLIDDNSEVVILSHEHPAFTFRGMNRAKMKLPAFVLIQTERKPVIIVPAANSISSGTNYPPTGKEKFLSPYLKKNAMMETMEIFPFDDKFGLIELPPVQFWTKD